MHAETLGKTLYSYLRLVAGSVGVFFGLFAIRTTDAWGGGGVIVGGLGLALALHEAAYVCARYTAAYSRTPPSE
jgi:hypothetical protein